MSASPDHIIRIACCTDTHGHRPGDVDEAGLAAWLHGGDVCHAGGSIGLESMQIWARSRSVPLYAVRGNHDVSPASRWFTHCNDITGQMVPLADSLWLAGIGWTGDRYYDLPAEADLEVECNRIRRAVHLLPAGHHFILLTHYPPHLPELAQRHSTPAGWMFRCIRALIDQLHPIAVVQGHLHEWAGESHTLAWQHCRCLIVNPGRQGATLAIDLQSATASCLPNHLDGG